MKEEPLGLRQGGTTLALSTANFDIVKENLRNKGCLQGLANLAWLHNEFSIPGTW